MFRVVNETFHICCSPVNKVAYYMLDNSALATILSVTTKSSSRTSHAASYPTGTGGSFQQIKWLEQKLTISSLLIYMTS
jgi:hypothetical protein